MRPIDLEAAVIAYLKPILGVPVATRVPNPRPASHVRVGRIGGQRANRVQERPTLLVECWAPDSGAAFDLASRAWDALDESEWTFGGSMPVTFPDPDTASPRYQFVSDLIANLKE